MALEIDFLKHEGWTDKVIDALETKRLEIEIDEPATYQALNRHCYNELVRSEGRPQCMKELKFYHRWLKSLWRFDNLPVDKSDRALKPA